MRLVLTLGTLFAATPIAAQVHSVPSPHPAPLVWQGSGLPLTFPADTVRASTGFDTSTLVGAGIGAAAGYFLATAGCGIGDRTSCGGPRLVGLALGALVGAMIGSTVEGDQPKPSPG